jgi:TetR/AcrR family transcriptional regulator, cholesterol catabolism regulator
MEPIKEEITQKCCMLFTKYGTKSITMDDIARELGMSKKTIYQHFSDKDDVVMAFMIQFIDLQKTHIEATKKESENVIDEMIKSTEHMKTMMSSMNPSLVFDLRKYHPKSWAVYLDFKKNFLENFILDCFNRGIEQGYYRKDLGTKILARMRVEEVEWGFNQDFFPQSEFALADVQAELFTHFMYGIATLKGHKLINKYKQITEEE